MHVYYRAEYVMAATAFDTTRKAEWIAASLSERPIHGVELVAPESLTEQDLAEVHEPSYVTAVRTGEPRHLASSNGLGWDERLFPMVLASNGGAVGAAVHGLETGGVAGSLSSGLHHAKRARGDGFCTFNGLALAARAAQRAGASRILLIDLDAHCGGGTFELLGDDASIDQLDVAVDPFDAYTPVRAWTLDLVDDAAEYLPTIRRRLEGVDRRNVRYDLVIYNAGMDAFEGSAVGGLGGIDEQILAERERLVFDWAEANGFPVAFVIAGGYATAASGRRTLVDLHRHTIAAGADLGARR